MKVYEVTFNRNVKLGAAIFRKGDTAQVPESDIEHLAEVIETGYTLVELDEQSKPVEEMTVPELKEYAVENSIDLGDAKKRDEILEAIQLAEKDSQD